MSKLIGNNYKPEKDNSRVHDLVQQPSIVPVDYKTVLVDNRRERLDTLVQYSDGSLAKVVYFRQRLAKNDSVTMFSMDLNRANQQYERIDGLEILLQGSLSSAQDNSELKTTEISVEAHIRPPVIPNVGDVVLMDFGRGTLGFFSITASRRLTHRRNTLYEVTLTLNYEIADQVNDKYLLNLNAKVVEVLKYSAEYLKTGQNPLITPAKAALVDDLRLEYDRLLRLWFRKFYTRFYETCFLPNQAVKTYDGFFMRAIRQWFSMNKASELTYFKIYNDEEFPILKTPSVWQAITHRDKYLLKEAFAKAVSVKVDAFRMTPQFAQIRFSGFGAVIMPASIQYSNDIYTRPKEEIGNAFLPNPDITPERYYSVAGIPLINPVDFRNGYVFSREFYNEQEQGQSHIELQLHKYLNDDTLDMDIIEHLVKDVQNWGELEQYYLIPVLLILVFYGTRRM